MLRLKLGLCWSGKRGYTPASFFSRGKLIEMKILSTMSPTVVCVGVCEMGRHNSSPFKKRRLTFPPHVKKSDSLGPEVLTMMSSGSMFENCACQTQSTW